MGKRSFVARYSNDQNICINIIHTFPPVLNCASYYREPSQKPIAFIVILSSRPESLSQPTRSVPYGNISPVALSHEPTTYPTTSETFRYTVANSRCGLSMNI